MHILRVLRDNLMISFVIIEDCYPKFWSNFDLHQKGIYECAKFVNIEIKTQFY